MTKISYQLDLFNAKDVMADVSSTLMIGWGTLDLKYSNLKEQIKLFNSANKTLVKQLNIFDNCGHKIDKNMSKYYLYLELFVNWFKTTIS